jgi:hypothetical protein
MLLTLIGWIFSLFWQAGCVPGREDVLPIRGWEQVGPFAPVRVCDQAIELASRALKDHLNQHHLWSAKWSVIQVQLWCGLLFAQIYHGLQVEIAGQTGVEVFDVSIDLLVCLTPRWLRCGLRPIEQAVRFGREQGLIRPSTRNRIEVPWVDPAWVVPPPADAVQPRAKVCHRPPKAKGKG